MHTLKIAPVQTLSAAAPRKVRSAASSAQAGTGFGATLRAEYASSGARASATMPSTVRSAARDDDAEQRPAAQQEWSGDWSPGSATKASANGLAQPQTAPPATARSGARLDETPHTERAAEEPAGEPGNNADSARTPGGEAVQRPAAHGDERGDESMGTATKANTTLPPQTEIDAPRDARTVTEFGPALATKSTPARAEDSETAQSDGRVGTYGGAVAQKAATEQSSSSDPHDVTAMHANVIVRRQAVTDDSVQHASSHPVSHARELQKPSATRTKTAPHALAAPSLTGHAEGTVAGPAATGVGGVAAVAPVLPGSDAMVQGKPARGIAVARPANSALHAAPARDTAKVIPTRSGAAAVELIGNGAVKPAKNESAAAQTGATQVSAKQISATQSNAAVGIHEHESVAKGVAVVAGHAAAPAASSWTAAQPWTMASPAAVVGAMRPKLAGATPTADVSGKGQSAPVPDTPRLEVGVFDDVHGWLRIRAELDPSGSVSATLAAASGSAHDGLKAALPEMARYLQSEAVPVHRITVHRMGVDSGAMDGARSQGQPGGDAAGQQSKAFRGEQGGSPKGKTQAESPGAVTPQGTTPAANQAAADLQRGAAAGLQQWLDGLTRVTPGFGSGWRTAGASPGWVNVCA